ncbi:hypothetical protein DRW48_04685 [Paracoccus suum]|uniref:Uncharacterized protein n=1 Tax=Paracoccus suum TaxID=2259340 RepID=A0A344PI67_9RHOB|nr:tetratricopeptide repeat protein [Paracoccus suum]AXC49072.1 hypothetical protein DRW48_04685 [Paracoccus suum]
MSRILPLALIALTTLGPAAALAQAAPPSAGPAAAPESAPEAAPAAAPETAPAADPNLDADPGDMENPADEGGDQGGGAGAVDGNGADPLADAAAAEAAPVHGPITHDLAGPYLAARQAADGNDFAAAAAYFMRALAQDPHEPFLIDSALVSLISAGQVDRAVALARDLEGRGDATELTNVTLRAALAKAGDWEGLLKLLRASPKPERGESAPGGDLLDGMLTAWAELGAGRASESIKQLEKLARLRGAKAMIDYNLALVKASVGDFEGAEKLMASDGGAGHLLGTIAHAEVLAQLDRRDEALSLLKDQGGDGAEPAILDLSARLASGSPVPFTALQGPLDGVAQTFLTFATALASGEEPDPLALVQARLAAWLRPELGEARLVTAQLLQQAGQYDLAEPEYDALRRLGEVRPVAELARVDALARADRLDDAEKAATVLTAAHPELASAWVALGDILRQREKYAQAVPAYTKALGLIEKTNSEGRWFPLYARGIAYERSGDFAAAEADMRAALKIRPEQAQILNYLGYSFIDRGHDLDEALGMIEKAAKLRPDDGYIQDSLGWGLYRLGRYAEAVTPMERAATQMSNDPLVNDHLGDVYWMVGRTREAEIQWSRALNLLKMDPPADTASEVDAGRLRAKLDRGLDAVLSEEKAGGKPKAPGNPAPVPAKAQQSGG